MRKGERAFWGVFFILAAAVVIISKLGMIQGLTIYQIIIGIILTACIIKSILYRSITGLLFAIAFAIILFERQLGLEAITPWPVLLAAALGSIGFSIIFPGRVKRISEKHWKVDEDYIHQKTGENYTGYETVFGSGVKYIKSDDFKGIDLKSVFGGMKVYFEEAQIVGDGAVINLEVVFGGAELYIPKDWDVRIDARCVFGGINEKNKPSASLGPVVRITGEAVFGGVEIIYI